MNLPEVEAAVKYFCRKDLNQYDFILLLPDQDETFNATIVEAFNNKLKNRKGVIIYGQKAKELITLYSLYEFSGKIIIGSFCEPYGRKLKNLILTGIATEDELIDSVVLGSLSVND